MFPVLTMSEFDRFDVAESQADPMQYIREKLTTLVAEFAASNKTMTDYREEVKDWRKEIMSDVKEVIKLQSIANGRTGKLESRVEALERLREEQALAAGRRFDYAVQERRIEISPSQDLKTDRRDGVTALFITLVQQPWFPWIAGLAMFMVGASVLKDLAMRALSMLAK